MPDETPHGNKSPDRQYEEIEGAYGEYARYATHLRTWFIAYGVGAIVLLCRMEGPLFSKHGLLTSRVLAPFLVGICAQVLLAFVNKYANWAEYAILAGKPASLQSGRPETKQPRWLRLGFWLSDKIAIDLILDVSTLVAYSWGTVRLFAAIPPQVAS